MSDLYQLCPDCGGDGMLVNLQEDFCPCPTCSGGFVKVDGPAYRPALPDARIDPDMKQAIWDLRVGRCEVAVEDGWLVEIGVDG